MKALVISFVILIIFLIGPQLYTEWNQDRQIKIKIESSLETLDITQNQSTEQSGYVKVIGVNKHLTEEALHTILTKQNKNHESNTYNWQWYGVPHATVSAQGLDRIHHFANSYLVGFTPFETKYIWVPLYTLTVRKHYEFDHVQYSGFQ